MHFYSLTIVLIGLLVLPKHNNLIFSFFAICGRHSYHIFLMQILYFRSVQGVVRSFFGGQANFYYLVIEILINLAICSGMGIIFKMLCGRIQSTTGLPVGE